MKEIAVGTLAAFHPARKVFSNGQDVTDRFQKGVMYYRRLGRTNLMISEISLGGSPLPDWELFLRAIERGINYIDTSCSYNNGNSERQIGHLFKEIGRDKVYVSTKFHIRGTPSEKAIIDSVNGSLKRLGTDTIDVLSIHGAEKEEHLTDERVLGAFEKLKKEGKYRFCGLSCHSNHHRVISKAIECGHYDMVQLGYNVFDIVETEKDIKTYEDYLGESGIRELIALAKSKDVGVVAMKTLKVGGRRQNLEKYKTGTTSLFQAMLKWALENRNVTSVVTEMLNYDQLNEDLGVIGTSLREEERKTLYRYVARNSKDYCHMCGVCRTNCPAQIETTDILRLLAYHEDYGKTSQAKAMYSRFEPERTAVSCQNCGNCEKVCPYGVPIIKRIHEAHQILSSS
jgi:predicted aldo/keto reductase-like oxidoreductase